MADEKHAERLERLIRDVMEGRHLKATPADAPEREAIMAAARLAGAREAYPRMSPAFRRRLASLLETGKQPAWMSRRAALVAGLGIAAGALGGAGLGRVTAGDSREPSPVAKAPPVRGTGSTAVVDPRPGRWVDVAAMSDLPEGQGVRVTAGAVGAFLFREGDKVLGVTSICSHLPCELHWAPTPGALNCPCHNANFDRLGHSLSESYPLPPLPKVGVRVTAAGRVEVLGT